MRKTSVWMTLPAQWVLIVYSKRPQEKPPGKMADHNCRWGRHQFEWPFGLSGFWFLHSKRQQDKMPVPFYCLSSIKQWNFLVYCHCLYNYAMFIFLHKYLSYILLHCLEKIGCVLYFIVLFGNNRICQS